jgi:hypothetical protein
MAVILRHLLHAVQPLDAVGHGLVVRHPAAVATDCLSRDFPAGVWSVEVMAEAGAATIAAALTRGIASGDASHGLANRNSRETATGLFLAKRLRRVEASGAGGRNRGGRQAGRDDDEQTHGVGDRIEDVNDLTDGGGGRRGQQQRGQSGG